MQDRLHRYGNLEDYYLPFQQFFQRFFQAYIDRKDDSHYRNQLPLEWRGWQLSLIELDDLKVKVILTYPLLSADGSKTFRLYSKSDWVDMPNDVDEIIAFHQLGEFVWQYDFPTPAVVDDDRVWNLAVDAGDLIATQHMSATNPSFEEAQRRMIDAYGVLFELEQTLRLFIEQVLAYKYPADWWSHIPNSIRDAAEDKQARPTNLWFEDFNESKLRFTELDHLRQIVDSLWPDFRDYFEDKEYFDGRMQYLTRPRHRIAHVNTLSAADAQEFRTDAERILRLIRPHTRLSQRP